MEDLLNTRSLRFEGIPRRTLFQIPPRRALNTYPKIDNPENHASLNPSKDSALNACMPKGNTVPRSRQTIVRN